MKLFCHELHVSAIPREVDLVKRLASCIEIHPHVAAAVRPFPHEFHVVAGLGDTPVHGHGAVRRGVRSAGKAVRFIRRINREYVRHAIAVCRRDGVRCAKSRLRLVCHGRVRVAGDCARASKR